MGTHSKFQSRQAASSYACTTCTTPLRSWPQSSRMHFSLEYNKRMEPHSTILPTMRLTGTPVHLRNQQCTPSIEVAIPELHTRNWCMWHSLVQSTMIQIKPCMAPQKCATVAPTRLFHRHFYSMKAPLLAMGACKQATDEAGAFHVTVLLPRCNFCAAALPPRWCIMFTTVSLLSSLTSLLNNTLQCGPVAFLPPPPLPFTVPTNTLLPASQRNQPPQNKRASNGRLHHRPTGVIISRTNFVLAMYCRILPEHWKYR